LILVASFLALAGPTTLRATSPEPSTELAPEPAAEVEQSQEADLAVVDRISRIESAVEADEKKLDGLRAELETRQRSYEEIAAAIKEIEAEFEAAKTKLEALPEGVESAEALALRSEMEKLEGHHALAMKKSSLLIESRKTIQAQFQSLQLKLQGDRRVLDELLGATEPPPVPKSPTPPTPPTPATEATRSAPPLPIMPGVPGLTPGDAEATADTPRDSARPETPEQMAARRQATKRADEARKADQAMADFVDRKQALEEQIELEKQLLHNAEEARDNGVEVLDALNAALEEAIAEGAGQAKLKSIKGQEAVARDELDAIRAEIDSRKDELGSLHERLEGALADQLLIAEDASRAREKAESARNLSIWLESPLHPENLLQWVLVRGPRIVMVAVAAALMVLLVRLGTRVVARIASRSRPPGRGGARRADTLALSFKSASTGVIFIGGALLMLQEAGVNVATVLGGAAIFGVAVAFGAQNLMRDYFNGLIILLEDQYELNDLLTIGDVTGRVERVNLRTTVLRDLGGRVHFIPNGEIKALTNHTYAWSRAVFDIPVAYSADVDQIISVLRTVATELREDPLLGVHIIDEPEMLGVNEFGESGPIIRFMVKTEADEMFPVKREMLRRIKNRFDELGIEIPVPHRVVLHREPGERPVEKFAEDTRPA